MPAIRKKPGVEVVADENGEQVTAEQASENPADQAAPENAAAENASPEVPVVEDGEVDPQANAPAIVQPEDFGPEEVSVTYAIMTARIPPDLPPDVQADMDRFRMLMSELRQFTNHQTAELPAPWDRFIASMRSFFNA